MELIKTGDAGANDSAARDCMTCRYRDTMRAAPPSIQRMDVCRRMPPAVLLMPGPGGTAATVSVFPGVGAGVWCYQWEASKLDT